MIHVYMCFRFSVDDQPRLHYYLVIYLYGQVKREVNRLHLYNLITCD